MTTSNFRTIDCIVTFLSTEKGGRQAFPSDGFSRCWYRPHLVVDIPASESVDEGSLEGDDYLGVCFVKGPDVVEAEAQLEVQLALVYEPEVDYSKLVPDATFTIREGSRVVGFGRVIESPFQVLARDPNYKRKSLTC